MDRASSLIFPGSRTLAAWWRQIQSFQPTTIHIGYGFVHRVEALVRVVHPQPIDALTHLLLKAVTLEAPANPGAAPSNPISGLQQSLRLPQVVIQQLLLSMEKIDLLTRTAASGWQTTERGQSALQSHQYSVQGQERKSFSFQEDLNALGERQGTPRYVPLAECATVPWQVEESLRFEPKWLQDCIAQTAAWKQLYQFPLEVESLVQGTMPTDWQQVLVDRPERFLHLLTRTGKTEPTEWVAFAAKADGWVLFDQEPILRLPASALMEKIAAPSEAEWHEAWRSWCRQRQLPTNEVENCTLSYQPSRLIVKAPERLIQRLRAAKSDLLKGEAWLLVGDGYLRTAVQLTLQPGVA